MLTSRAAKVVQQHSNIDAVSEGGTVCINKSNPTEVQKTINSMFHWYKNAKKCYVYLQDVSTMKREVGDRAMDRIHLGDSVSVKQMV